MARLALSDYAHFRAAEIEGKLREDTKKENTSNAAADPALVIGGYLDHDELCTGGDGIGLEL